MAIDKYRIMSQEYL